MNIFTRQTNAGNDEQGQQIAEQICERRQPSNECEPKEKKSNNKVPQVLLIDEDRRFSREFQNRCGQSLKIISSPNPNHAWRKIREHHAELTAIFLDMDSSVSNGIKILETVRKEYPGICIVVMSSSRDANLAIRVMRTGAYDYLNKSQTSFTYYYALIHKWQAEQSFDHKLADYVRLHQELMQSMQVRTFLATDVCQSYRLKSQADPFLSQYSFYLYQRFIETRVSKHNGIIHSTAGDGTMICFQEPWDAILAANEIITHLPEFNCSENWLSEDFYLRLGIHTGPVVLGHSTHVSGLFSKTLDIAGHIQKDAKKNRIEVSEETVATIREKHLFLPCDRIADGARVYYLAESIDSQPGAQSASGHSP